MLDAILDAKPSVGSWRHDPMSISEIDAHPDADRIWATIRAFQDHVDGATQEGFEQGSSEVDAAVEEETDRCVEMLDDWRAKLLDDPAIQSAEDIRDALVATDFSAVVL